MSRIAVYHKQIEDAKERRKLGVPVGEKVDPVRKMEGERYSLYLRLDELLKQSVQLSEEPQDA